MSIRVLLADDSDTERRAIGRLSENEPEIEIIGEATNFAQTFQMTNDLKPGVVVLDLHLPDEDQVTFLEVKSRLTRISRLLAISIFVDDEAEDMAELVGAVALLDKGDLYHTLIPTLLKMGSSIARVATAI